MNETQMTVVAGLAALTVLSLLNAVFAAYKIKKKDPFRESDCGGTCQNCTNKCKKDEPI